MREQQPGGGAGMSPAMAMQFMPQAGGGAAAGGGTGGGAAAGGGTGGGGAMAGAGPWAALAAVIAANEKYQVQHGDRSSSESERMQDALSGKVLERDVSNYASDIPTAEWASRWGNPEGAVKNVKGLSNPKEHLKDVKKWGKKLKDIF